MTSPGPEPDLEYILPLKWRDEDMLPELSGYLSWLVAHARVTVVDGSGPEALERHTAAFPPEVQVIPCAPGLCLNGKVAGVLTALPFLRGGKVIIADDDVRYDDVSLARMNGLLDDHDLVRPQNHFVTDDGSPLPWHARWDTGRTLLNRAFASDYPGTLGVGRAVLAGGYDGNLLFENLELIRTVRARDGRVINADDLFVARRPPAARWFLSQRVRQAYDSFAEPRRMAVELAVLPAVLAALHRPSGLLLGAVAVAAAGESGRRRAGGRHIYPRTAALWSPLWLLERGLCSWLALGLRARGGVRYHGTRLSLAANSPTTLRDRHREEASLP